MAMTDYCYHIARFTHNGDLFDLTNVGDVLTLWAKRDSQYDTTWSRISSIKKDPDDPSLFNRLKAKLPLSKADWMTLTLYDRNLVPIIKSFYFSIG
jgi:hypothetical protein